ncbi:MAG: DUF2188 domain-containing protein [Patescibacteria group bacterium]
MAKQIWVSPDGDGWKVHSAGSDRAFRHTENKNEAIIIAQDVAKNNNAELIVQNKDGEIGWRNSFGNDPYPPKG